VVTRDGKPKRYTPESKNPVTGRTEKFTCPCCGASGKFRRYWDWWKNEWSADTEAGVCDRSNTCGYWKYPDKDTTYRTPTPRPRPQATETPLIPLNDMYKAQVSTHTDNTLKSWFYSMFEKSIVDHVWSSYGVTETGARGVTFWQFAPDGVTATTGRVMEYHTNGHRDKESAIYWSHNTLHQKGYNPQKHLFGLRVAMVSNADHVAVMESEKSALLCECARLQYGFLQDYTFTATGGANMIDTTLSCDLQHLSGRHVVLFPDSDHEGRKWVQDKAYKYNTLVSDIANEHAETLGLAGGGYDIGDYVADLVADLMQGNQPQATETAQIEDNTPQVDQVPTEAANVPQEALQDTEAESVESSVMCDPIASQMVALNNELLEFLQVLDMRPRPSSSRERTGREQADRTPTRTGCQPVVQGHTGGNSIELANFLVSIGFDPNWQPPLNAERETQLFPF